MTLCWYMIAIWSPYFKLGFTLYLFYEFGQMNDMSPPWTVSFRIVLQNATSIHSPPPNPGEHSSFYCLHSFAFSDYHIFGIIQYVAFLDGFLSHSSMHSRFIESFWSLEDTKICLVKNTKQMVIVFTSIISTVIISYRLHFPRVLKRRSWRSLE